MVVAGDVPVEDRVIAFPWSEVKRLTGLDLSVPEMKVILTDLGFRVSGTEASVKVAVPSWRPDVEDKADLVEEIMRIAGLERVLPVPFPREPATNTACQARFGVARAYRGRYLVLYQPSGGLAFWRRKSGALSRKSDCFRLVRHAAEFAPGPSESHWAEC